LLTLHDAQQKKLFDSVLVVSDRTVLDSQLQEAIFDFQRTTGVVASIKGEAQSKSGELAEALSGNKKIIVCTIQTFPAIYKKMSELASNEGKRFAVIADEAHSSQTGSAAAKLKQVLSAEELQELEDGGEFSAEDMLASQMAASAPMMPASPTLRLPPPPRPKPWSYLVVCQTRPSLPAKATSPRRFMCIPCGKLLRRVSSSMC
jgi:type I restriction enzyme R subunit